MINEKTLEEKLEKSKKLFERFDENLCRIENYEGWAKEPCFVQGMSNGIKTLYLQNKVIIEYLQEIYKNQSEVKIKNDS